MNVLAMSAALLLGADDPGLIGPAPEPVMVGHRVYVPTPGGIRQDWHVVPYAGRRFGLPRTGHEVRYLSKMAEGHAISMARRSHQDHNGWEQRFVRVNATINPREAWEICAESWPGQSLWESSLDAWGCWRQSPGHWSRANSKTYLYGAGIARSSRGIHYTCIIGTWR